MLPRPGALPACSAVHTRPSPFLAGQRRTINTCLFNVRTRRNRRHQPHIKLTYLCADLGLLLLFMATEKLNARVGERLLAWWGGIGAAVEHEACRNQPGPKPGAQILLWFVASPDQQLRMGGGSRGPVAGGKDYPRWGPALQLGTQSSAHLSHHQQAPEHNYGGTR